MKVGTKSVLFGAHQFLLHPMFVALAWWKLYGFPWNIRYWVAFFVHDLGYFGKPNMDGPEGETHVELGAKIMTKLFGPMWGDFCLYHSRFYAKKARTHYSCLCVADKLSFIITPHWLYIPFATLSGEIYEYMEIIATGKREGKYATTNAQITTKKMWHTGIVNYMTKWVEAHKTGKPDTWTPEHYE